MPTNENHSKTVIYNYLRTDTRPRYHYFRYVNKGGGVHLDNKSAKFDNVSSLKTLIYCTYISVLQL